MPMLDLKLEVGPLHLAADVDGECPGEVVLQPQHHHLPLLDGDGHCALCREQPG